MQSTNFISSDGEGRNPFYEGQFDGESLEQTAARLHWARAVRETSKVVAHQIEVDRDIKAANLQLLVDAVLAYNEACVMCEDNGNDGGDIYDAGQIWTGLLDLARGLKQ